MIPEQEQTELAALFPGEIYVLTQGPNAGEEIVVKQVTFGKLKVFIDAVSSLFLKMEKAGLKNIEDPETWPDLFSLAHEEIIKIMGAILRKDSKWFVDVLMPIDGLHIFGMIVRQNINKEIKKKFQDLAVVLRSAMSTSPNS
jgi:hypothetical protein